jgi:zinc/manganese transport system substrate-binding protein
MFYRMKNLLGICAGLLLPVCGQAAVKVATLHPLLADVTRQVGGAQVEIIEVFKPGSDVHHFEPATKDIAAIRGSALLLACGKNLETYLDKLRDTVGPNVKVVEVGRTIPSVLLDPSQDIFVWILTGGTARIT